MKKIILILATVFVILAFGIIANAQTFENKEIGISFNVPDNYVIVQPNYSDGTVGVNVSIKPNRVGFTIMSINNEDAYFDGLIEDETFKSILEWMVSTERLSEQLSGESKATFSKKDVYTTYIGDMKFFVYDGTYKTGGGNVTPETLYLTTYAWAKNGRVYYMEYYRFGSESDTFRPEEFLKTISYEPGTIKIVMNGKRIYPDTPPAAIDGRTLVPIRAVAEAMGYTVSWNAEEGLIYLLPGNYDGNTVIFGLGYGDYLVNDETHYLDVPPIAVNGRTYIPLRAAAESMGADVSWDGNSNTAYISY